MRRIRRVVATGAMLLLVSIGASPHGGQAGDVVVTHPFATPTVPGARTGAAYLVRLENKGDVADRLLRASTPAAASVELHSMKIDAQGIMRMREVDAIPLGPGSTVTMRPGQGVHLMLVGLRAPLREGATFPMTLTFERGGSIEVEVVVQSPRGRDGAASPHPH